ncbi:type II secretion system protein [Criibacterium bergeronii]|uniref:Type II secretion system protein n=2 Tax=Criibacterium bergeronii TaxID=1871336 RepID=A0A552V0R9_9FIRM|nr:type II secretion system protein [Criibacterium bergeronii]
MEGKMLFKNKGFTLVEMIISVGILAVVSTFVLKVYLASNQLSQRAYQLDKSVQISRNLVELTTAGEKINRQSKFELLKNMQKTDNGYDLYFDKDFNIEKENPTYLLEMKVTDKDGLDNINIKMYKIGVLNCEETLNNPEKRNGEQIYELNALKRRGV